MTVTGSQRRKVASAQSVGKKKLITQFMIKLMNLTLGKAHLDMVF